MSLEPPFYVISDTHWNHKNIVEYCGRPADHNGRMIANWQETISEDDVVLHLGDLFMGRRDDFPPIAEQLPGKKFLIRGNHDKQTRKWYKTKTDFELIDPFEINFNKWRVLFTHRPVISTHSTELNCHGHIHNGYVDGLGLNHINFSVEVRDYRPQPIIPVLSFQHFRITKEDLGVRFNNER